MEQIDVLKYAIEAEGVAMPQIKQDDSLSRRHNWDMLFFALPVLLLFVVTFQTPDLFPWTVGPIVVLLTVGFARQQGRSMKMICPACQAKLTREITPGEKVTFFCRSCDTIWETGVHDGSD